MRCCLDLSYHQIARRMTGEIEAELPEDLRLLVGAGVDQDSGDVRELGFGLGCCQSVARLLGFGLSDSRGHRVGVRSGVQGGTVLG